MNLRPHPLRPAELNLTPLVDVVFLLLLFFMISTTFEQQRELPITLPEAEGQPTPQRDREPLVIAIDRDSRYAINEQPLALDPSQEDIQRALAQALAQALARPLGQAMASLRSSSPGSTQQESLQDRALLIEADAQTPHQAVMRVLDAAQELGLTRMAFAATDMPGTETTEAESEGMTKAETETETESQAATKVKDGTTEPTTPTKTFPATRTPAEIAPPPPPQ